MSVRLSVFSVACARLLLIALIWASVVRQAHSDDDFFDLPLTRDSSEAIEPASATPVNPFLDHRGGLELFTEENRLFIQNEDGTNRRALTSERSQKVTGAHFSKDGASILFRECASLFYSDMYYRIPVGKDDRVKKRVSFNEYETDR